MTQPRRPQYPVPDNEQDLAPRAPGQPVPAKDVPPPDVADDQVLEESWDSFPASDPPSH